MDGTVFLVALALVWIVFAVIQDLRKREIADWLNFSLIVFALGFRLFHSLFTQTDLGFFYQGLIGLGIFFALGNAFYYGRLFAGGDAKLMIALGTVLPFSGIFYDNLQTFVWFLLLFLFGGGAYSLIATLFIGIKNHSKLKKEFSKQFKKNKKLIILTLLVAIVMAVWGFFINPLLIYLAAFIFILPYIYIYAKSVDESCMVKSIEASKLTVGDWLYKDVKVGKRTIKASWDGLDKKDITLLRKKKRIVLIRHGVPFSPAFLIGFLALLYLRNPFW